MDEELRDALKGYLDAENDLARAHQEVELAQGRLQGAYRELHALVEKCGGSLLAQGRNQTLLLTINESLTFTQQLTVKRLDDGVPSISL